MRKTVLILGSDFAPSGRPPATRIRFFAKHLPEFGFDPIILTSQPDYYEWPVDTENERLLPKSLEVIRTPALPIKWTRKFGVGDIGMRTLWQHWRVIKQLVRTRKIDLIFIPVPPYVPMILGRLAHRKFGIPYVIDYIDPWVTDYYKSLPKDQRPPKWFFADTLSRAVEPFSVKRVAHITGVSKGTTDSVIRRYDWLSEDDATEIPYGAEADDFEYLRSNPSHNCIFDNRDGFVHMSSVGACIPGMYGSVRALFEAVRLGLARVPENFERLKLHFVGTNYSTNGKRQPGVLNLAAEAGIEKHVDEHPERIPYLASLQVMLDSQGLLLIGSDEPHYTASKVFPYILAHRPLLAIFHEQSSVVNILRETLAGEVVTFDADTTPLTRSDEISKILERFLACPPDQRSAADWEAVKPFTTRAMTARLASSFDRLTRFSSNGSSPVRENG